MILFYPLSKYINISQINVKNELEFKKVFLRLNKL